MKLSVSPGTGMQFLLCKTKVTLDLRFQRE